MSDQEAPARAADVRVGDEFVYTTPLGREMVFTVDSLAVQTKHGGVMPRSVSDSGQRVFISDGLLEQDWWRLSRRAVGR